MAQVINASYSVRRKKAIAGQIADTSLYNIDGACAAAGNVPVGRFVALNADAAVQDPEGKYKPVSAATPAGSTVVGVAIVSAAQAPEGVYEDGYAVNVMTHGRVFVEVPATATLANVALGNKVGIDATGKVVLTGAVVTTNHTFTGELVESQDDAIKLAKIQLVQNAGVVASA
jgi:hypothetical protein